jgi:malate/lactate dehydrogenase
MAYAGFKFVENVLRAKAGERDIGEIGKGAKEDWSVATTVYYCSTITNTLPLAASLIASPIILLIAVMPAYVESDVVNGCPFFASPCRFGTDGVEEIMGVGTVNEKEKEMILDMKGKLAGEAEKGRKWIVDAYRIEDGRGDGKI